ncbi:MAG: DNA polymerase ligase N-terminal domain-containing protein [Gemmataceae bacterium]
MPRFVLLHHDHPHPHLDLMLEVEGVLWTWRLSHEPSVGVTQQAQRLGHHRLAYLDYEGPVSGGRGRVARLDSGLINWVERGDSRAVAELFGGKVRGRLILVRQNEEAWEVKLEAGSA